MRYTKSIFKIPVQRYISFEYLINDEKGSITGSNIISMRLGVFFTAWPFCKLRFEKIKKNIVFFTKKHIPSGRWFFGFLRNKKREKYAVLR
jgi:hypothetical protein